MVDRIARGLDIGRRAGLMRDAATKEEKAADVWEREFARGTTNWAYWMRIIQPYIQGAVGVDPSLTPEQKQIAVKECMKRIRQGLPLFLSSCANAAKEYSKVMVPVMARSPLVVLPRELIV